VHRQLFHIALTGSVICHPFDSVFTLLTAKPIHTYVSYKRFMTATKDTVDTRDRIMDEAEKLFADLGFKATSMRAITQAADVNLAAVNYHFGSKESLIEEVILRKLNPINAERLERLNRLSDEPDLESILDAFYRPAFEYFQDPEEIPYLRLLGRSLYETGDFSLQLMEKEWMPLVRAFHEAFKKAVPELDDSEIMWRFHFTIGAMILTISKMDILEASSCGACRIQDDFEPAIKRLIQYTAAGFREGLQ
jgi:AcrR family transcriptional regulator